MAVTLDGDSAVDWILRRRPDSSLLESFTVHLRALLDFFYSQRPKDSDVVAEDFFEPPETWLSVRPEMSTALVRSRARVNKEVAHLTYDRQKVSASDKAWDFQSLSDEVGKTLEIFQRSTADRFHGTRWSGVSPGSASPVRLP